MQKYKKRYCVSRVTMINYHTETHLKKSYVHFLYHYPSLFFFFFNIKYLLNVLFEQCESKKLMNNHFKSKYMLYMQNIRILNSYYFMIENLKQFL